MNDRIINLMPGSVYNERVENQYLFPGLQRVENQYAAATESPTAETAEAAEAEDASPHGKNAAPGRPKTSIFNDPEAVPRLAAAVRQIHDTYYVPASRRMEVDGDSFDEADFLLCLYYVFVKRGYSPSALAAKPFYAFLSQTCGIRLPISDKTFGTRLNKVLRTGKDFHRLTPELLASGQQQGAMTVDELPRWQQMFEAAERVLAKEEEKKPATSQTYGKENSRQHNAL